MPFYSFRVQASHEVELPDQAQVLGPGTNAFNALVDDLDAFKKLLTENDVIIVNVSRLDDHEPVDPTASFMLPGSLV
jgi:hypothetical protein